MSAKQAFRDGADDVPGAMKYTPQAAYYHDMDYVEYIQADKLAVSQRVDEFLTLLWDRSGASPIGFRLKGFRNFFETEMKQTHQWLDQDFILLVTALETIVSKIGDDLFTSDNTDKRAKAYKTAFNMAKDEDVRLYDIPLAA